jgi:dTDP-4-amino-4,6-dideoxyglucose formyltransferase
MKIFVVTDNRVWFEKIDNWRSSREEIVKIFCSPKGENLFEKELKDGQISSLDLKSGYEQLLSNYDIGFSCHCKQIFPAKLVEKVNCFNVHPGLNPYNRGWFPQVFSIINKLPIGATIHEMDEKVDHGPIIAQEQIEILESDTSKKAYEKIIDAEFRLFDHYIESILVGDYRCVSPEDAGNYNSISDFKELCEIDLNKQVTFREAINYLRAMTFDGYNNAYFYDKSGRKIYVSINIEPEA